MSECAECKKARDKEVRSRKDYRKRRRVWFNNFKKTEKGKLANKKYVKKARKIYPQKFKARDAVKYAKKVGKLKQQSCEICGDIKSHAHHSDYEKALVVIWLCSNHHNEKHGLGRSY